MADKAKILIVDDDPTIAGAITDFLATHMIGTLHATTCREAEQLFCTYAPDAAVIDYALPDGDALGLLPRLKEADTDTPLIILTGHASIDLAVRAIKLGAEQFLVKPVELPALLVLLERAIDNRRQRRKRLADQKRTSREALDPFLGSSEPVRALAQQAMRVRESSSPILIQGETGCGKGVLARWLHQSSARACEPFVDLNCAGLSKEFLETELFGHEKGAFTGAVASKPGLIEIAKGGTLFLDEIGDLPPEVQPKLLKVLEEKSYRRMGDVRERNADFRLIVASHVDLLAQVNAGKFRQDLYFRVSALPLEVPALRQRSADIGLHAEHMLTRLCGELGRERASLNRDALQALERHAWPGNLRELRNVLERALLLSDHRVLTPADLRFDRYAASAENSRYADGLTLTELEKMHIDQVLRKENGHVEQAAMRLGIPRSSLYQKIKLHRISVSKSFKQ